jgi:magnesium-transporting ATPase (P-type)
MHYDNYPIYKLITYSHFWIYFLFGVSLIYFSEQIYLGVFIAVFVFVIFELMLINNLLNNSMNEDNAKYPLLFASMLSIVGSIYFLYIRTVILIKQQKYNANIEKYFGDSIRGKLSKIKNLFIANSSLIILFVILFYTTIPKMSLNSHFYADDYGMGMPIVIFKVFLSVAIVLLSCLQIYYGNDLALRFKRKINIPEEQKKNEAKTFMSSVLFWINPFEIANYVSKTYYEFRG